MLINRDLEELSEGMMKARMQGQVFTIREKWEELRWRVRTKIREKRGRGREEGGAVEGRIQAMVELEA